MLAGVPHFRGVAMREEYIGKRLTDVPAAGVVNLDDLNGTGTHWVAWYNHPDTPFVEYFDSFGLPPPQEVESFLKATGKPVKFNDSQLQHRDSNYCGYYVVYYIKNRAAGHPPLEVLNSLTQRPSVYNEQTVSRIGKK